MDAKAHWERVYETKGADQVSWFQAEAELSSQLIASLVPSPDARILDVGAGASRLVDGLVHAGYRHVTVLDVSAAALRVSQERLGAAADQVQWHVADVLSADLPAQAFDLWHDRAVFHFLTEASARARYVLQVRRVLQPGGIVIVATFADDGPRRCSGLDVCGYSPAELHHEFGAEYRQLESHRELHYTPGGVEQAFTYGVYRYEPTEPVP